MQTRSPTSASSTPRLSPAVWLIGGGVILLYVVTNAMGGYGYFNDEFYYIACAKRLAWGYVDHPPLAPLLLRLSMTVFGDSVLAIRLLSSLAGGLTVALAGMLARRLGGGGFAQVFAALVTALTPLLLVVSGFYSMNAFEALLWVGSLLLFVRILDGENPRLWLLVGLLLGVGLQNKHTTVVFGLAMAIALMLTSARRQLAARWPWLAAAVAGVIILPNVVWQVANGWPSLEFYRNAMIYKNVPRSPGEVILDQVMAANPAAALVWAPGLIGLLISRRFTTVRALGWIAAVIWAVQIASQSSRPDRIAAIYPLLFAAGAVVIEGLTTGRLRWIRACVGGFVVVSALALLPIAVPVLPPTVLSSYLQTIGYSPEIEQGKTAPLPQYFADRFGWQELADTVAAVYHRLPPDDQARAAVFTMTYGTAGALELLGAKHGLPCIMSSHNNYFLWGPCPDSTEVVITVLDPGDDLPELFEEVSLGAVTDCEFCMDYEDNQPIYVAKGPRFSIKEKWALMKHFE
ncbi:MAG: glycosyltransferase family 39 protein [Candidatus Eisenbacteria bacterium]|nr:glycosyltransferase family 39 protein [Candidatus Eisenbacteria bacterium]